jgi:hypothetical protein
MRKGRWVVAEVEDPGVMIVAVVAIWENGVVVRWASRRNC